MKEKHVGSDASDGSGSASSEDVRSHGHRRVRSTRQTALRIIVAVLALTLLVTSAAFSLLAVRNSYANTSQAVVVNATSTTCPSTATSQTPTAVPTTNPTTTNPTPKPTPKKGVTPTPTKGVPPTPTPTPVTPTPTSVPPTPTPTDPPASPTTMASPTSSPTASSTSTVTTGSQALLTGGLFSSFSALSLALLPTAHSEKMGVEQLVSAEDDPCTPTPVATAASGSTPATNPTSAQGGPPSTGGGGSQTQSQPASGNSILSVIWVTLLSLLGLALCGAIGWYVFRRVLLPKAEVKLPPSGARPWSRTRNPNPDSSGGHTAFAASGVAGAGMGMNMSTSAGSSRNMSDQLPFPPPNPNFALNNAPMGAPNTGALNYNFGPTAQGFGTGNLASSAPGSFGSQNMPERGSSSGNFGPGSSFNGFADDFIPASPLMFPQNDANGNGASANGVGFAPASSAFTAMYGLPDDPFGSSQSRDASWLEDLSKGKQNNPGAGRMSGTLNPPPPAPNGNGSVRMSGTLNPPPPAPNGNGGVRMSGTLNPPPPAPNGNGGVRMSGTLNPPPPAPNGNGGVRMSGTLNPPPPAPNGNGGVRMSGTLNPPPPAPRNNGQRTG